MAKRRRKKGHIPGLVFQLTVEPRIINEETNEAEPVTDVDPITWEVNQNFALQWHEGHLDLNIRQGLQALREKVARRKGYR